MPRMPRSLAQEGEPRCAPRLPTDGRSSCASGHCPTTSTTTAESGRRLRWPSTACASFERHALTWQITSRSWIQRATTPTPAIPAGGCLAHRRAPRPHSGRTADAGPPGHRTPTPDTDTWTLRRPHRTPDAWTGTRGHWTLGPDTGRRTPAEDADTVTKARPASGPPGLTTPSDRALGRPTVFLWTAPAALDSPCRLGVRPPASARLPLALSGSCSVAPLAKPRLGALLSLDDFGSSVERTATLHPL